MDLTRLKKLLAGASVAAISITQIGSVFAAYGDVSAGVWYEEAVDSFVEAGYLDSKQTRFRGGDNANRAEFIKLVVELNGGILSTPPAVASFDDVASGAWYYGHIEEAAKEGWVRGDGDCYGGHPCYARPSANINRAEAAALIVRAFALESTGAAPQFVDNPSGQWYTDAIQTSADHCVLQGDDATKRVRPGDNMNRAEMVVMLHRVDQGLTYGVDCGAVPEVKQPTIMGATATSATTLEVEFNVPLSEEAAEDASKYAVTGAADIEVTSASLTNSTTVELTLGSATTAGGDYTLEVSDMETSDGATFSDTGAFSGFSPVVLGEGTLEVSLSSKNPTADTFPQGAVGVVQLSLDFTASCDDSVTVTDVTLLHEGFGAETNVSGVYAAIDGARVTRKRTIDSEDQTADLRFSNALVIAACGTVTVDFVADYGTSLTAAGEHVLTVELATDLVSNAKETRGNFPLRGETFRVAAVTTGTVTVAYRVVSPDEVEVGDVAVVVGKFEVSTNSVEDVTFYSLTLEQNSSASDSDLRNIAIRRTDGTLLTPAVVSTVGDFVTLVFDPPFTLLEGDKVTLEVVADIIGGAGDSIIMHFEENSDIFAVGSLYGYGVNGQLYGAQIQLPTETSSLPDTVTIDAGEFTIEIDGPPQQSYTRDDKDARLAKILITTGGEPVDIKDLFIMIEGETSTGAALNNRNGTTTDHVHEQVEDVEVRNVVTGRTVSAVRLTGSTDFGHTGSQVAAGFTYQIYRFDDFIVEGKEEWEFRIDFIDNGASASPRTGDRYRIAICGEPTHIGTPLTANTTGCFDNAFAAASTSYQMSVEGVSTGDKVGDVRPRGNITGNFHRVANASLSVAVKAGANDTAVANAKNVPFMRFEGRAGEAEDVLLTKAVFEAAQGSLLNVQNYALWVDSDGDSVVDTILEDGIGAQSSRVTFADLAGGGYVIPAEETVVLEVHGDVSASRVNNTLQLRFSTGTSVTYLEAEELDDGSNLSGLQTNGTCSTTCDIVVTTAVTPVWTLVSAGDLFVSRAAAPVRNRQLLGGAVAEPVLRLTFRSDNEDIDVTDIQVSSSGTTSELASVERLDLYKAGATTAFATATIGGCGSDDVINHWGRGSPSTDFCAVMEGRQLVVPEGEDIDILIRPRMKGDAEGGTVNEKIQLWITGQAVLSQASGSGAVRARGNESSNDLIANDGDSSASEGEVIIGRNSAGANASIIGSDNVVVLAKITSITNGNPAANGSPVPTGVTPFGQFTFTAASHNNVLNGLNDVVLSGVVFNVNATNVQMDQAVFRFYNKADSSVKASCTAFNTAGTQLGNAASGSFVVECKALVTDPVDTEIDAGTSRTFVLEGTVVRSQIASTSTSTLQASIQEFTSKAAADATGFGVTAGLVGQTRQHINWRDTDTVATNFYWVEYDDTVVNSTSYKT